jgi:hypothetical protein
VLSNEAFEPGATVPDVKPSSTRDADRAVAPQPPASDSDSANAGAGRTGSDSDARAACGEAAALADADEMAQEDMEAYAYVYAAQMAGQLLLLEPDGLGLADDSCWPVCKERGSVFSSAEGAPGPGWIDN